MVFHVLIWKIDDMVANSVVVSLLGFFVGPTFPLVLDIATNQNTKQALGVSLVLCNYKLLISSDAEPASGFSCERTAYCLGHCVSYISSDHSEF